MMNHEIELKLRLNHRELPLLEKVLAASQFTPEPTLKLLNRYFDTPDMSLSQGGAALRIRQQGIIDARGEITDERIIQTLKTRGSSATGLHQRMEWDWPLTQVELEPNLILASEAKNQLSPTLDLTAIAPLFTTDFQRQVWLYEQDETLIELVLDQGQVATNEHNIELLELELELKRGEAEVLFQLAQHIADQCPVLMSDISKAERGYGLLALSGEYKQIKKDWAGKVPSLDAQSDVMSCFKTFFSYQLASIQRRIEYSLWDGQQEQLAHARWQLELLGNLLGLFTHIARRPEAQLLQRKLEQAAQAPLELGLIWGQLSIACGHWLFGLANDSEKRAMTTAEKQLMSVHVEQLLKGYKA